MSLYRLFRLKPAIAGFLLVLVVASAYGVGRSDVSAVNAKYVKMTDRAGNVSYVLSADFRANVTNMMGGVTAERVTRSTPLSNATLGQLAKRGLKGGVAGIVTVVLLEELINGTGWAISELQDQVMDAPAVPAERITGYNWCTTSTLTPSTRCTAFATPENLCPWAKTQVVGYVSDRCVGSPNGTSFYKLTMDGLGRSINLYRINIPTSGWDNEGTGHVPTEIPDATLGDKIKDRPDIVNGLLKDPRTGGVIITPEVKQLMDQWQQELELREGLDPGDGTPVTGGEEIPDGDGATGGQTELEFPVFCTWAKYVCDFIDWVKVPEPETPTPELDIQPEPFVQQTWSSGLGGGSCPSPSLASVSMSGTTQQVEFSVEPICQLGTTLRPWLIALATLLTPMIIGGFRSSKDA